MDDPSEKETATVSFMYLYNRSDGILKGKLRNYSIVMHIM